MSSHNHENSLVKKEKARLVEDSLIRAAETGQLKTRVTDDHLKTMLEQISESKGSNSLNSSQAKVHIQRKKYFGDDDDLEDDSDL